MKKIVLVTGGFDPLHSGHIAYFEAAKKLGDILVVGVNSDEWLTRKKGRPFMRLKDRMDIVRSLKVVDQVIEFDDTDGTARRAIHNVRLRNPHDHIIFANGGDRTQENIPEMDMRDLNLKFEFGVGGNNKVNSSSWILNEWKAPKTLRPWGYYRVLHEVPGMKVKELTVNPGCSLSMQRHANRSEYWIVSEGVARVEKEHDAFLLHPHETISIEVGNWHQLSNPYGTPVKVVEIQYGTACDEEDIERQ